MEYVVSSENEKKLARFENKITKAAKKYYSSDCRFADDAIGMVREMKDVGYFKKAPDGLYPNYREKMNAFFKGIGERKAAWKIEGENLPAEWEHFPVVSGYDASLILKPDVFWEFSKYGFDNFFDFAGNIGAIFENFRRPDIFSGYKWTASQGNRQRETIVSADMNGDFRLVLTDVTPGIVEDPLGNKVTYRPASPDFIAGYHSVEPAFLVALMRYSSQEGIPTVLDKDNLTEFLEGMSNSQQRAGLFGDFGGHGRDHVTLMNLAWPIPNIDKPKHPTFHRIGTISGGSYGIYVDDSKNLVIRYESRDGKTKGKHMVFQPSDTDHLIRGLFQQTLAGQGRTSASQLENLARARYLPETLEYIRKTEEENERIHTESEKSKDKS